MDILFTIFCKKSYIFIKLYVTCSPIEALRSQVSAYLGRNKLIISEVYEPNNIINGKLTIYFQNVTLPLSHTYIHTYNTILFFIFVLKRNDFILRGFKLRQSTPVAYSSANARLFYQSLHIRY